VRQHLGAFVTHCPFVDNCELYSLFRLRASLKTWQIRYCEASYQECRRYQLAERGEAMPPTLLPNGKRLPMAVKKER
jgi:hypothetical protein